VTGYDVATQPALVHRHIGFLSANTAIYDRMSAWELVEYFG
jgi:sodium transport system ATP-binding protein